MAAKAVSVTHGHEGLIITAVPSGPGTRLAWRLSELVPKAAAEVRNCKAISGAEIKYQLPSSERKQHKEGAGGRAREPGRNLWKELAQNRLVIELFLNGSVVESLKRVIVTEN